MATRTFRKAIGVVKDQTSISLAKVAGSAAPDLEVLVLKATSHDDEPADEKYVKQILNMLSNSNGYVNACASSVSKRLSRTRDWIVALKTLMLVHQLVNEGETLFAQDLMLSNKKGVIILDMSDFRDDAHSNSWDHSRFVRTYSSYLVRKLELMLDVRSFGSLSEENMINEIESERVLGRLNISIQLLVRFVASKPFGTAEKSRLVLLAMELLVKDSFVLYNDVSNVLKHWLDCFLEMDYAYCVNVFDLYVDAAKIIEDLQNVWCNGIRLLRPIDFPEVQIISDELLVNLEVLLREKRRETTNESQSMNEVKPENQIETTVPQPQVTEDLVNLKDDAVSEQEASSKMALALFSSSSVTKHDNWVDFTDHDNWELELVESTSNLSKQNKADFAGGFDIVVLNGIYDKGTVEKYIYNSDLSSGSASSMALLPGTTQSKNLLALPAPDGSFKPVEDPFAASLLVPPPTYVQIADMERKQELLSHEQMIWQQYANDGMQGQMAYAKIASSAEGVIFPYAMSQYTGLEQPGSYYYPSL